MMSPLNSVLMLSALYNNFSNGKFQMRSDGQAMGSLSASGGSSQTRGSQEHLGSAGRGGSDR
jgi:hypothetical protein